MLRGRYVLGKAATLNADVGDVPDLGRRSTTSTPGSTYWLDNAFSFDDIAPFLVFGSGLDNQRAVTVKSTFLQNRNYLDFYYREAYTVVEMEAGPFCNAVYEVADADRYPTGEAVSFAKLPIDFGIIHYASDTPYTQARTLGRAASRTSAWTRPTPRRSRFSAASSRSRACWTGTDAAELYAPPGALAMRTCSSPTRTSSPARSCRPRRFSGSPLTSTGCSASSAFASPPVPTMPASLSRFPSRIISPRIGTSRGTPAQRTPTRSTTNTSVSSGPMTPPAPRLP
jgi:hypothetical protein